MRWTVRLKRESELGNVRYVMEFVEADTVEEAERIAVGRHRREMTVVGIWTELDLSKGGDERGE